MPASSRQSRHLPAFILLALAEGPLHGHAIRSELQETLPGYKADPGATYRTLQALEEAGDVTFHWDTNSRGPARKVYTLAPSGWDRLEQWKADIETRLTFLQAFLDRYDHSKGNRVSPK
ncbi:PadR family transcriptional regulator [Geothrix oryzae]|uniref:PadR family transcriptional regulator n=1 Tax=Geothrix oryzae TaxID=2927975 RepID=A0ABN6V1E9_9BACT|nr:PadR family transcriptional regulator [Geothrix oryzae]BDU70208.1 PadR family transcriptional regulator [Geothrix oryzae]